MRGTRIIVYAATGFSLAIPPGQALAQGVLLPPTRDYQTQLYRPPNPSTLDKNYGLPQFGMPGSELPKQRTLAPGNQAPTGQANPRGNGQAATGAGGGGAAPDALGLAPQTPDPGLPDAAAPDAQTATTQPTGVPDFFADRSDFVLPQAPAPNTATPFSPLDTPMFTTADSSKLNNAETSIFSPTPASGARPSADGIDTPMFTTTDGGADPAGQPAAPR